MKYFLECDLGKSQYSTIYLGIREVICCLYSVLNKKFSGETSMLLIFNTNRK